MRQAQIRPAQLDADRDRLIALLKQYSTVRSTPERFRWMYLENPHGRAAVFLAVDELTGEIVGSGAVLPRRMWVAGAVQTASIMADFWIHPDYRSLGPA